MASRAVWLSSVAAASVCGTAAVLSFAPVGWRALMPLALAALFFLAARARTKLQVFVIGLAFGFSFFTAGLWWIFQALSGYIGLPVAAAAACVIAGALLLALLPAAALTLGRCAGGRGFWQLPAFAAGWTLTEWLRSWLLTGFTWLSVGYSQIPAGVFTGWAPVAGIYGVGLAMTTAVACIVGLPRLKTGTARIAAAAAVGALLLAPLAFNAWAWTTPAGSVSVSLLQGNVKQELKWEETRLRRAFDDYLEMTQTAEGRIVILPETALPVTMDDMPAGYADALAAAARARGGRVIAGMFTEDENGIYNAAAVFGGRQTDEYRKRHLTPYGEYLPLPRLMKPLLDAAGIPFFGLSAGKSARPLTLMDDITAGISICYEDTFGGEWRAQLPAAQMLVNITNDGWFDGSFMAKQHLQMAQARALEFGRWMARATNTGETAVIDSGGRIVASLPPNVSGVLDEEIRLYRGATPYVYVGDAAAAAAAVLLLVVCALTPRLLRRRARRRRKNAAQN